MDKGRIKANTHRNIKEFRHKKMWS